MKPLVIRTDAGPRIGIGHLMRCLAIAESWYDKGGKVSFVMNSAPPAIKQNIQNQKLDVIEISSTPGTVEDATDLITIANKLGAEWIVVDGYQFGTEYQKIIKESEHSLLFIDDYGHASHYYADIVLNQNIYADISLYPFHEPFTKFLLGSEYVLLRREFLSGTDRARIIPHQARKILVTLGGGDPENITLKVIEAIKDIGMPGVEVIAIIGGVNPHFSVLKEYVADTPGFSILVDVNNMPDLMAWADIAVSAGGSTCWELVFMGLPFLSIILSDNQSPIVTRLDQEGATISLGYYKELSNQILFHSIEDLMKSQNKRILLHRNQKKIIDGNGCSRVIRMLI